MNLRNICVFCGACLRGWADRGVRALRRLSNIFPYFSNIQNTYFTFNFYSSNLYWVCFGVDFSLFFIVFILCYIFVYKIILFVFWGAGIALGWARCPVPLRKPPKMAQKPEVEIGRRNCVDFYLWFCVYFYFSFRIYTLSLSLSLQPQGFAGFVIFCFSPLHVFFLFLLYYIIWVCARGLGKIFYYIFVTDLLLAFYFTKNLFY